jgi:hypothetical protein
MMTKDASERIKRLKSEVLELGRNPEEYLYDLNTLNAYRIEHTKLGDYAYILINDKQLGKEVRVDLYDFYTKRLYSYRWTRSNSDPIKDYPHTNIPDGTGKKINLQLHVLVMGGVVPDKVIDHNDGDHYNASRSNLNYVTIAQNNQNRHPNLFFTPRSKKAPKNIRAEYISLLA